MYAINKNITNKYEKKDECKKLTDINGRRGGPVNLRHGGDNGEIRKATLQEKSKEMA